MYDQPPAPADQPETPLASTAPVMDVQPPQAVHPAPPPEAEPDTAPAKRAVDKPPKPPRPSKQPGNGVGAAIAATVIIVLGLAVLITYAYLKTNS